MLSRGENKLLTRIGPAAPMGSLMRGYWLPASLSDEISAPDGQPVRVRLLGVDAVVERQGQELTGVDRAKNFDNSPVDQWVREKYFESVSGPSIRKEISKKQSMAFGAFGK